MKATVLVVEDNEALADNMAELFEDAGAEVTTCRRAPEALAQARETGFDLALVDLRLQCQEDGLSLVPGLRKASPNGEIVLITGNASLDSAIAAVRHGVYAYVLKPFNPEDLMALGERALAQVSLRREREALARDLATSEALYRGVVDTVEALIIGVGAEGHIAFCNRHACEVVGREVPEVQGKHFSILFADERVQDVAFHLARAAGGAVIRDREVPVETAEGDERMVRWTLTPLQAGSASRSTVLAVGIDVTERIALEQKSAENAAMAAMGELTTGLAHEIRNPLNAAKLQLELLERAARKVGDAEVGTKILERAVIVKDEIGSLSRMLEEFLKLARPQGLDRAPTSLAELADELVERHGPFAEEHGIEVLSEVSPNLPPVMADRQKLKQAFVNLISNALEAMRDQGEGQVVIGAAQGEDGWVDVWVKDTGPGLDEDAAERVFQPFYTTKPAGTGLGLSIVSRTVEMHGGSIALEPDEEEGTVARLTLPTARKGIPKK